MGKENKSYRIRTKIDTDSVVNVNLDQSIDTFEILSLTIDQKNSYRLMNSDTGIIVGRVLANGGFGIPNAKVSVFVKYEDTDDIEQRIKYFYSTSRDLDFDGVRYNLLPIKLDDECHQNVGTFPTKRILLDNDDWVEVFDKYYKYTTRTNEAGDYMIYGVPVGTQTVHCDIDLSDIGVLSQRPRDMVYKGANINQFESPNKFKTDTNLGSLAQIYTQDTTVYVYPFWGDTTDSDKGAAITRCDVSIAYKFEPTCVFLGSVITDTGEHSLSKKCVAHKQQGKMSEMVTGEGTIEMIRKTSDGLVEQFSVKGNQLIDSDGTWCYQIPMNLDYVITDEYGNIVLSDNPNKGIATRTKVRFRIGMTENGSEATARKRARFLVPNNPRLVETDYPSFTTTKEVDYEFGSKTKDENFRDLLWNKVYTVKSYIPRLQKSRLPNNKRHLGIKMTNHSGANNPLPFNNLSIKFTFLYTFMCALAKVFVTIVRYMNVVITGISWGLYNIGSMCFNIGRIIGNYNGKPDIIRRLGRLFFGYYKNGEEMNVSDSYGNSGEDGVISAFKDTAKFYDDWHFSDIGNLNTINYSTFGLGAYFFLIVKSIGCGIVIDGLCEDDDGTSSSYTPGTNSNICTLFAKVGTSIGVQPCNTNVAKLYNCIENQLAQENEVTSFNFYNDWINGVLYVPLWYRRIKHKRKFLGVFTIKAKDQWCSSDTKITKSKKDKKHLKLYRTCAQEIELSEPTASEPMGKLQPLKDDEVDVLGSVANDRNGGEVITFKRYSDTSCYGYQCHQNSRTYTPIDKGLIVEKETMLGDLVYYYKPTVYDRDYNNDLVTLFATDIVLLGSLNNCDIHGIPQFFIALDSTTYNMPPDLLLEDYEYKNGGPTGDDSNDNADINRDSRYTEYTGADWGNLGVDQSGKDNANENQYDNGGLFYGLTCLDSYTKPKSCINVSRICEFGVSLDESQSILATSSITESTTEDEADNLYTDLTPDGFVSYDEIYSMDYRSMFATLNGNWLKTKLDVKTGLTEYDLNHIYVENFDGVMSKLMAANTTKNGKTEKTLYTESPNYANNYMLEKSSNGYLEFRYGNYLKNTKSGTAKIYYYDYDNVIAKSHGVEIKSGKRFPRYENSFYFYFGLNEGKTAIDKFKSTYFSECTNDSELQPAFSFALKGNSWCGELDGYIAMNGNISTPYSVILTNKDDSELTYSIQNINKDNFYIGTYSQELLNYTKMTAIGPNGVIYENIPTGIYYVTITDSDDNQYNTEIEFVSDYVTYSIDVDAFSVKNNDLEDTYSVYYDDGNINWHDTFEAIATYNNDNRSIHGTFKLSNFSVEDFRVKILPSNKNFFGNTWTIHRTTGGVTSTNVVIEQTTNGGFPKTYYIDDTLVATVSSDGEEPQYEPDYSELTKVVNYPGVNAMFHWDDRARSYTVIEDPSSVGYIGQDDGTIVFGAPYGEQKYKIIITQLCYIDEQWVDTQNTVSEIVTINEYDFKMYVNGIDYDLIKNFKTGWRETLMDTMNTYRGSEYQSNSLYGWNDIFNIGKLNTSLLASMPRFVVIEPIDEMLAKYVVNPTFEDRVNYTIEVGKILVSSYPANGISTYYTKGGLNIDYSTPYTWYGQYCISDDEWTNLSEKLSNMTVAYGTDELNDIIERLDNIILLRQELAKVASAAFRAGKDETNLVITYRSNSTPITYLAVGNTDKTVVTARSLGQTGNTTVLGEFSILSDQYGEENRYSTVRPTLTCVNGEFRYIDYDLYNSSGQAPKLPYYVAIKDDNDSAIPGKSIIKTNARQVFINGSWITIDAYQTNIFQDTNPNVSRMFGVHFYNKPMYFNLITSWTGVIGLPVFNWKKFNVAGSTSGEAVEMSMNNMFTGYVYNGISKPKVDICGINIESELVNKIGNNDLYTNTNTERVVYTPVIEGEVTNTYGVYKLSTDNTQDYQYIEMPKMSGDVTVSDGYGEDYLSTIHGNFDIRIDGTMFMHTTDSHNELTDYINLSVTGSAATKYNVTYYVYYDDYLSERTVSKRHVTSENYPPFEATYDQTNGKWCHQSFPELYQLSNLSNYIVNNINTCIGTTTTTKWYLKNNESGTITPNYVNDNKLNTSKMFVVAQAGPYKAISPIIDYTRIACVYRSKVTGLTEDTNNSYAFLFCRVPFEKPNRTDNGSLYSIDDLYYIKNYPFKVSVPDYGALPNGTVISADTDFFDNMTVDINTNNREIVYIKITDGTSVTYAKAIKLHFDNIDKFNEWDNLNITDYIGVRHSSVMISNTIVDILPYNTMDEKYNR